MPPTPDDTGPSRFDGPSDPNEAYAFRSQADRVAEEKRAALEAPDVPWRVWWLQSGSKWYLAVGFLIADVWIVSLGLELGAPALSLVGLLVAIYLEFLLYRYLYYIPPLDEPRRRGRFRRTWTRPVEFGRWTPQGAALRSGGAVAPAEGPDPKEFL